MLENEFLIQQIDRFAWVFTEISLFCTTASRNEREFDISILSDTRSTAALYPRVHLQIVEIVTYDVLLESQEKDRINNTF